MEQFLSTADVIRRLYDRGVIVGETALRTYERAGLIPRARRFGNRRVWNSGDLEAIEAGVRARQSHRRDANA